MLQSINTSDFVKKVDLACLKSNIDELGKVLKGLNSLKSKVDKLNKLVNELVKN